MTKAGVIKKLRELGELSEREAGEWGISSLQGSYRKGMAFAYQQAMEAVERIEIEPAVICARCGNYKPGHATCGNDICVCRNPS